MKAVVAAFNQEKALVGAFSVLTNLRMKLFQAQLGSHCIIIASSAAMDGGDGIITVIIRSRGRNRNKNCGFPEYFLPVVRVRR